MSITQAIMYKFVSQEEKYFFRIRNDFLGLTFLDYKNKNNLLYIVEVSIICYFNQKIGVPMFMEIELYEIEKRI